MVKKRKKKADENKAKFYQKQLALIEDESKQKALFEAEEEEKKSCRKKITRSTCIKSGYTTSRLCTFRKRTKNAAENEEKQQKQLRLAPIAAKHKIMLENRKIREEQEKSSNGN